MIKQELWLTLWYENWSVVSSWILKVDTGKPHHWPKWTKGVYTTDSRISEVRCHNHVPMIVYVNQ